MDTYYVFTKDESEWVVTCNEFQILQDGSLLFLTDKKPINLFNREFWMHVEKMEEENGEETKDNTDGE